MRDNTFINESKRISKELKELSIKLEKEGVKNYHNEARHQINIIYGKGWREELELKDTNINAGK